MLLAQDHARFWSQYYMTSPYGGTGGASQLRHVLDDAAITALIETTTCDLTAVCDGRLHPGPRPTTRAAADQLQAEGYSLVFRHAERHAAAIAAVGQALTDDLNGRLDAHVYATPAGHFSFGWHFDAEEVFFLHLGGEKDFLLRQNTVHVSPLLETMPKDLQLERETSPVLRCRLHPGDWLYIPHGWWHMAVARSASLSLSLGLQPATMLDVLDTLRRNLIHDPQWRQRLPPRGHAVPHPQEETERRTSQLMSTLAPTLLARWEALDLSQLPRDGATRAPGYTRLHGR